MAAEMIKSPIRTEERLKIKIGKKEDETMNAARSSRLLRAKNELTIIP